MSLTNFYGCLYGCAWYITEVTRICWFINIMPNILLSWPFFWNLLKNKRNRLNPLCAMSIDEQYAATVQCYSQLLREDRYAIYILLTFTLAVMWSIKSSPTSGSVCNTFWFCRWPPNCLDWLIFRWGRCCQGWLSFIPDDSAIENMIWCISSSVSLLN